MRLGDDGPYPGGIRLGGNALLIWLISMDSVPGAGVSNCRYPKSVSYAEATPAVNWHIPASVRRPNHVNGADSFVKEL
jgi:hypothetical protein